MSDWVSGKRLENVGSSIRERASSLLQSVKTFPWILKPSEAWTIKTPPRIPFSLLGAEKNDYVWALFIVWLKVTIFNIRNLWALWVFPTSVGTPETVNIYIGQKTFSSFQPLDKKMPKVCKRSRPNLRIPTGRLKEFELKEVHRSADRFVECCQITPNHTKSRQILPNHATFLPNYACKKKVRKTVRCCCYLTLFPLPT